MAYIQRLHCSKWRRQKYEGASTGPALLCLGDNYWDFFFNKEHKDFKRYPSCSERWLHYFLVRYSNMDIRWCKMPDIVVHADGFNSAKSGQGGLQKSLQHECQVIALNFNLACLAIVFRITLAKDWRWQKIVPLLCYYRAHRDIQPTTWVLHIYVSPVDWKWPTCYGVQMLIRLKPLLKLWMSYSAIRSQ